MVTGGVDLGLDLPVHGALRGRSFFLATSLAHINFPWQGAPGVGSGETQWFWLFWSLGWHPMCLRFLPDSTDFRRRDLRGPTPVGASLDMACRSSLLLRSTQTLSTTLLGFEFLQRPQHVLSNLLDRPHASVWAGSSTIVFSSAFPLALSLAFSTVSALCLLIGHSLLLRLLVGMGGEVGLPVLLIYLAMPVVMCMVVSLAVAETATGVL